jgi:hypothetical protein
MNQDTTSIMEGGDFNLFKLHPTIHPSIQWRYSPNRTWPPLLRLRNNNVLLCEVVSLTTNPR